MSQNLDILTFPLRQERLIEASAGTGKTYTITGLYLRLLLGHGDAASGFGAPEPLPLPVDKILVVTFTEAATAELRERILSRIRQARRAFELGVSEDPLLASLLADVADQALACRLLLTAERQMDEAAIFTIHGFCQRMLTRNAFESGALFETEFVTDDARLRFEAVADYWRQHCYGLSLPLARAVRAQWAEPAALLNELAPHLASPDLVCLGGGESLIERHTAILQRISEVKTLWLQSAPDLAALIANSGVDKRSYSSKNLPNWLAQVGEWARSPTEDYQLSDKLSRFGQGLLIAKSPKGNPPQHPLFVAIDALMAQPLGIRDVILAQALVEVRSRIQQAKGRKQLLAFDDLLSGLAMALSGAHGDPLARRIRELYPVAMIDEFQYTDPQQYRIFSRLYAGQPSCGLYLIGDPKQAIYGFRGADIFTYMEAKRQVAAHYTLETNYRSTAGLVAAVNGLFAQSTAPFIYDRDIPFLPVKAKGKTHAFTLQGQPVAPLLWCEEASDGPLAAGLYRQKLATACAVQIHQWLVAAQQQQAWIGERLLQPGDIAILVRTGTEATLVRRALRRLGIGSVYLSNRDSVLASQEAHDLLRILEACLAPGDEVRVRSAMATALLGWSANQLAALNADELQWEAIVEQFREGAMRWQRQGVLPMIRHFLFSHQIPARLLIEEEGERRLTDALHVAELLQQAAATLPGEHALLRWLREQLVAPDGNADEQKLRLESERRLVQVVTIHKSKGLEYPLVLLPFIADWRPSQLARYHEGNRVVWDLLNTEAALAQAEQERLAEDLRLLYVALTRAEYLTWLGVAEVKNTKAQLPSALRYLLCATDAQPTMAARLTALQAQIPGLQQVETLAWPDEGYQDAQPPLPQRAVRRFQRALERNWWVTSYTALSAHGPQPANRIANGLTSPVPPVPAVAEKRYDRFEFPRGARPGTFLHSLFEGLDFAIQPGAELDAWIDSRLQGIQLATDWQPELWRPVLQQWVADVVAAQLQPGLALRDIPAARCLAEMEFLLPVAELDANRLNQLLRQQDALSAQAHPLSFTTLQGMLKGFMDLVFEHQGRFYVLDYKSNHLGDSADAYGPDALQQAMIQHRYDLQYQLYTLALHRYLASRLPDYDYERHIGGVFYLFLRGMQADSSQGIFFTRPEPALIHALDRLFAGEVSP